MQSNPLDQLYQVLQSVLTNLLGFAIDFALQLIAAFLF